MFVPVDLTTNLEMESLLIGTTQYILYPNFQAWFNVGEADLSRSNLQSFPYDLAGFREAVVSFELLGEGVIDGMEAYRLTGTGTRGTQANRRIPGGCRGSGGRALDKPGRPAPPAHRDHHRRPRSEPDLHIHGLRSGRLRLRARECH